MLVKSNSGTIRQFLISFSDEYKDSVMSSESLERKFENVFLVCLY